MATPRISVTTLGAGWKTPKKAQKHPLRTPIFLGGAAAAAAVALTAMHQKPPKKGLCVHPFSGDPRKPPKKHTVLLRAFLTGFLGPLKMGPEKIQQ